MQGRDEDSLTIKCGYSTSERRVSKINVMAFEWLTLHVIVIHCAYGQGVEEYIFISLYLITLNIRSLFNTHSYCAFSC